MKSGSKRTTLFFLCIGVPYTIIALCYVEILKKIRQSKTKMRELQSRQISVQSDESLTNQESGHLAVRTSGGLNKSPSMLQLDQLHKRRGRQQEKKEWRVTVMVGIILLMFLICTLPTAIFMELDPGVDMYPTTQICCYILSWMIGVSNPLVYVLFSNSYRSAALSRINKLLPDVRTIFRRKRNSTF